MSNKRWFPNTRDDLKTRYGIAHVEIEKLLVCLRRAKENQDKKSFFGGDKGAQSYHELVRQVKIVYLASGKNVYGSLANKNESDMVITINVALGHYQPLYPEFKDACLYWDVVRPKVQNEKVF